MEEFEFKKVEYDKGALTAKTTISYKGDNFEKKIPIPGATLLSPEDFAEKYVWRANNGLEFVERNGESIDDFFEKCENAYLDSIIK